MKFSIQCRSIGMVLLFFSHCLVLTVQAMETSTVFSGVAQNLNQFVNDNPSKHLLLPAGVYQQAPDQKAIVSITRGGTTEEPLIIEGEDRDRDATRLNGIIYVSADHVILRNLTIDVGKCGRDPTESFGSLTLIGCKNILIENVAFTGDGKHGRKGAHILMESDESGRIPENIEIRNCLIEKFGRFDTPEGKMDHGIYINCGRNITIQNNEIRNNASRGIQLFAKDANTPIENVEIVDNHIHHNGHFRYTDGIVLSSAVAGKTPVISDVTISNNRIERNAFSGIRINASATHNILITKNKFDRNGIKYPRQGADVFIDDPFGAEDLTLSNNDYENTVKKIIKRGPTLNCHLDE